MWKVTLPLREEQSLDKERDIGGSKSDAHVLNSGLAQAQPIKGKDFIAYNHKGSLSPFCEFWVSMSSANLTLPQDGHVVGIDQTSFPPANISYPLLTTIPRVGFGFSHVSILTCLGWCIVHVFLTLYIIFPLYIHLL